MESDSGELLRMTHATPRDMTINPLDNPVWHALTGPHRAHAIRRDKAAHYRREMAPFSALEDASAEAYADLAHDLPVGSEARLLRPSEEPLPDGWQQLDAFPILQMVARSAPASPEGQIEALSQADVPEMLDLVAAAKPGPFGVRTVALGTYLGIRQRGRLVAMAGERLRLPGYVELSAIAVHPEVQGQGLGVRLTQALMSCVFAHREVPFLHVRPENRAVRLYRRLGFETRRELWVLWRRPGQVRGSAQS
jgi:ribosomal protein S18 acetylase RimI-like enzyme